MNFYAGTNFSRAVIVSESVAGRLTPLPVSTEQRSTMKNSSAREVYGVLNEKIVKYLVGKQARIGVFMILKPSTPFILFCI